MPVNRIMYITTANTSLNSTQSRHLYIAAHLGNSHSLGHGDQTTDSIGLGPTVEGFLAMVTIHGATACIARLDLAFEPGKRRSMTEKEQ